MTNYKVAFGTDDIIEKVLNLLPENRTCGNGNDMLYWEQFWEDRIDFMRTNKVPWEFSSEWHINLYKKQVEVFDSLSSEVSGKKILEAGAGSGIVTLSQRKRGADIYLTDITQSALDYVRLVKEYMGINDPVHLSREDFLDLKFEANYFDIVWNNGVIEHYENMTNVLDDMIRVTKPGGSIIIAVPNLISPELLYSIFKKGRGTERYFSINGLKNFIGKCGLENIVTKSVCSVLPSFIPKSIYHKLKGCESRFPKLGILYYARGNKK